MASALFGSAPRTRRPSIPRSPSSSASLPPTTPPPQGKALPPLPGHAQPQTQTQTRSLRSKKKMKTGDAQRGRPDSPDVETMMKRTPRPRRTSLATFPTHSNSPIVRTRSATGTGMAVPSSWRGSGKRQGLDNDHESVASDYGMLLDKDASMDEMMLEGDGSESDSSMTYTHLFREFSYLLFCAPRFLLPLPILLVRPTTT
uniref:Superoxide dismutase [Cu-Zn] (EC) n=1 Tax=Ganoderma boninense TaxID=34458 RepID=A0A5K1K5V6_9APHY|nr:Superoxide dismutase [Cu-Zn] (EC [Ganoderma boninense]